MTSQIAFDNFYIGASKHGADAFAKETWVIKHNAEKALDDNGVWLDIII